MIFVILLLFIRFIDRCKEERELIQNPLEFFVKREIFFFLLLFREYRVDRIVGQSLTLMGGSWEFRSKICNDSVFEKTTTTLCNWIIADNDGECRCCLFIVFYIWRLIFFNRNNIELFNSKARMSVLSSL